MPLQRLYIARVVRFENESDDSDNAKTISLLTMVLLSFFAVSTFARPCIGMVRKLLSVRVAEVPGGQVQGE